MYDFYKKVLSLDLVIPNFKVFEDDFKMCYNEIMSDKMNEFGGGK